MGWFGKLAATRPYRSWLGYHMLEELGMTEAALNVAERAAQGGEFQTSVVLFNLRKKDARATGRFADVAEELGLVAYWRERGLPKVCKEERRSPVCRRAAGTRGDPHPRPSR
ncbi:MAG: hypothetical protein WA936_02870 [Erythrobacter sp.]|uniref:hypothetical protein n=1 Tax=Erythrobacter sp. TaxID=1042 RepID=UPI003C72F7F8